MISPYRKFLLGALPVVLPLILLGCGGSNSGPTVTSSIGEAIPGVTAAPNGEAVENNAVGMSAPLPAAANPLISAMKVILKRPNYERQVLWPYRDSATGGNITIGVGHLVPNKAAFLQLGLMQGSAPATSAQKGKAWDDLLKAKVGMDALKYQTVTNLQISPKESDTLLTPDVETHIKSVNAKVSGFFSLPFAAQIGLTDIDYNVGSISKFPSLIAAVKNKNWQGAYLQSHRIDKSQSTSGIGVVRNQQIMSLFLAASQNLAISSTNPDISVEKLSLKTSTGGDVSVEPDSIYPTISPKEGRVYTKGVVVNLTAKPDKDATFDKWQGNLSGSNPEGSLTMSDAKSVTATFFAIVVSPQNPSVTSLGNGTPSMWPHIQFSASGGTAPYKWSLNPDDHYFIQAGDINEKTGLYQPNRYLATATVTATDAKGHTGSTTVHVTTQDFISGLYFISEPQTMLAYSIVGGTLTPCPESGVSCFRLAIFGESATITIKNNSKVSTAIGVSPLDGRQDGIPPGGSIKGVVYPAWAYDIKPTSP